jgi:hypothetical protein
MPWCPRCRIAHREGSTVCGNCGRPLTDALPPVAQEDKEPRFDTEAFLVTVPDGAQATVVESLLASCDILSARVYHEAEGFRKVMTCPFPYGIDIYVPSRRLDEAKVLLDAGLFQPPEPEVITVIPAEPGRDRTEMRRRIARWIVLLVFIVPLISWIAHLVRSVLAGFK